MDVGAARKEAVVASASPPSKGLTFKKGSYAASATKSHSKFRLLSTHWYKKCKQVTGRGQ